MRTAAAQHCTRFCLVDAGGVPAEWVEGTPARSDQPTIVYFVSTVNGEASLEASRPTAAALAATTDARVLTVDCSSPGLPCNDASIERGCAAYAWLLDEGCKPELTAFTHDPDGAALVEAILVAAKRQGLPLPAGGALAART